MTDITTTRLGRICDNHEALRAIATCAVCGKPLCEECRAVIDGETVCEDRLHAFVAQNWNLLYRVHSDFEADMISRNLDGHGIATKVFSSRAYKLTIEENAGDGVNVFVPSIHYQQALELMSTLDLAGPLSTMNQLD